MSVDIEVASICHCTVFQTGHKLARLGFLDFTSLGAFRSAICNLDVTLWFHNLLARFYSTNKNGLQKAREVRLLVATEQDAVIAQNGGGGDCVCAGRSYRRRRRRRGGRWRAAAVEDRHPPRHRCAPARCLRRRFAGPSRPGGEPSETLAPQANSSDSWTHQFLGSRRSKLFRRRVHSSLRASYAIRG